MSNQEQGIPNQNPLSPEAIIPTPWDRLMETQDLELQKVGVHIPEGDYGGQELRVINVNSGNSIKLLDIYNFLNELGLSPDILIGRLATREPYHPDTIQAARGKSLEGYKMLRTDEGRRRFLRAYRSDTRVRDRAEDREKFGFALGTLTGTARGIRDGWVGSRRFLRSRSEDPKEDQRDILHLSNDVLVCLPFEQIDGSFRYERMLKPLSEQDAMDNIEHLCQLAEKYGWEEIPILTEATTYAFKPHDPDCDGYSVKKYVTMVNVEKLKKLLTPEGFEMYRGALIADTTKSKKVTDISAGLATETLVNMGIAKIIPPEGMTEEETRNISRGAMDKNFVKQILEKFCITPPQKTSGRRKRN